LMVSGFDHGSVNASSSECMGRWPGRRAVGMSGGRRNAGLLSARDAAPDQRPMSARSVSRSPA
jgi:hypothetical protein